MNSISQTLGVIMALLLAVAVFATLARRLALPHPSLLALGGVLLALVPGLPRFDMPPDIVLLVFLPPLLFSAGWRISWRDLVANARPIGLLAVGLVLFTTVGVAYVASMLHPALPLVAAFVLGAIVSPTDALAASAVARQASLPRRLISIIEGESVANDATGLVVYRIAVSAAVLGSFSLPRAAVTFVLASAGGAAIGFAVGWLSSRLQEMVADPPVEIAIQLVTGYAAYLPSEALGVSGVFAAATAGIVCGHRSFRVMISSTRLQAGAFWDSLDFLANAFLFLVLGLQWRVVLSEAKTDAVGRLIMEGALVALAAIVLRMVWVFAATIIPRKISPGLARRDPTPPVGSIVLLGWSGMRGVLSLVAAFAIPHALPGRAIIIFFAFCVIAMTLILQGLTLPLMVRVLGVGGDGSRAQEERVARIATASVAKERLADLAARSEGGTREAALSLLERYNRYLQHLDEDNTQLATARRREYRRIRHELTALQRTVLIDLHERGEIGHDTMLQLERELDFEEQR